MEEQSWTDVVEALGVLPARVNETIFPGDPMQFSDAKDYLRIGRAGLRCVRLALLAGQAQPPKAVLDLPSGYGRVLRFLQAAFPQAEMVACDIRQDAIQFCEITFGVKGVIGHENPDRIELPADHFDVIWCGSLLTHIEVAEQEKFLRLFERVLRPQGIAVFTTTGRLVAEGRVRKRNAPLTFTEDQLPQVLADYDTSGFGFAETLSLKQGAYRAKYGDCLISPSWMCAKLNEIVPKMQLLLYTEGGWGPRTAWAQDCIAIQKSA
jgi:SAM-dependent methyltransferase